MFRNKKISMLFSLVAAILLWAYVIGGVNPTTTQLFRNVPVQLLNEESLTANGLALSGDTEYKVDVTLSGKRADLLKFNKKDIIITASLAGCTEGENYVALKVTVPGSVTVSELKTQNILVNVEERIAVYKAVSVAYTGELEAGKEPSNPTIVPEQIEIKGAKSLVSSIAYLQAKIDYGQISEDGSVLTVAVTPVDSEGEEVQNVTLSSDTAEIAVSMLKTKSVPLTVDVTGEVAGLYEVTNIIKPEKVTIKGPADVIDGIDSLTANAIDISDITATSKIPVEIDMPEGVTLAEASSGIHVWVGIKGIESVSIEIPASNVAIEGIADGFNAYINDTDSMITIVASAKEEIIKGLVKDDFKLYVNLENIADPDNPENLVAGVYDVPIEVLYGVQLENISIAPESLQVTVTEAE